MRFNFSEVSSNINEVEESFRLHCCGKLRHFLQKYEHILGKEIWDVLNAETLEEPGALLSAINSYATLKGDIKIYLLIDEYDNFTNTILSTYGTDLYRKATHGEGYIRSYSGDECVAEAREKGGLKLITVVWRSWELALTEEVDV